jgi:iron complex outermembrane receptor protein
MPQNRWSTTVKFSTGMTKKVQLTEIIAQYIVHFGQYRTALNETTSAPYHLVHIAANFKLQLKHPIGIRLGVKNLFNTAYIDHLSRLKTIGMDNPGRNIYIAINYQFNQSLKSKK